MLYSGQQKSMSDWPKLGANELQQKKGEPESEVTVGNKRLTETGDWRVK